MSQFFAMIKKKSGEKILCGNNYYHNLEQIKVKLIACKNAFVGKHILKIREKRNKFTCDRF